MAKATLRTVRPAGALAADNSEVIVEAAIAVAKVTEILAACSGMAMVAVSWCWPPSRMVPAKRSYSWIRLRDGLAQVKSCSKFGAKRKMTNVRFLGKATFGKIGFAR